MYRGGGVAGAVRSCVGCWRCKGGIGNDGDIGGGRRSRRTGR